MKQENDEEIASLIRDLRHADKRVVRQATDGLIRLASSRPELVQRLERILADSPKEGRWPVAYVLAHISSPSDQCLNALKGTLDSRDPDIRWAVALLLIGLGRKEKRIHELLCDLARTGAPTQRRMAVYCIRDIASNDSASLDTLLEALRDSDPMVRVATVTSLKSWPEIGKKGLDLLLELFLMDSDPRVKYAAALTLAESGAATDEIPAALKKASQSGDPLLRKAAKAGLSFLQKKGPQPPPKRARSGPSVD